MTQGCGPGCLETDWADFITRLLTNYHGGSDNLGLMLLYTQPAHR